MEQTVVAKIQIKVPTSDRVLLHDTMKSYSDACNFVSEYIYTSHDLKRFHINQMLYNDLRTKYGMRSQMAQSVIITVIARYKTKLYSPTKRNGLNQSFVSHNSTLYGTEIIL